jgi:hypothetical protein
LLHPEVATPARPATVAVEVEVVTPVRLATVVAVADMRVRPITGAAVAAAMRVRPITGAGAEVADTRARRTMPARRITVAVAAAMPARPITVAVAAAMPVRPDITDQVRC